uniref:Uncharacterized protein n=1 Tax=Cannabis sativa TaxID=3483 RepID=A0A803PST3_CANSA
MAQKARKSKNPQNPTVTFEAESTESKVRILASLESLYHILKWEYPTPLEILYFYSIKACPTRKHGAGGFYYLETHTNDRRIIVREFSNYYSISSSSDDYANMGFEDLLCSLTSPTKRSRKEEDNLGGSYFWVKPRSFKEDQEECWQKIYLNQAFNRARKNYSHFFGASNWELRWIGLGVCPSGQILKVSTQGGFLGTFLPPANFS